MKRKKKHKYNPTAKHQTESTEKEMRKIKNQKQKIKTLIISHLISINKHSFYSSTHFQIPSPLYDTNNTETHLYRASTNLAL